MKKYLSLLVAILCLYLLTVTPTNTIEAQTPGSKNSTGFLEVKTDNPAFESVTEAKDYAILDGMFAPNEEMTSAPNSVVSDNLLLSSGNQLLEASAPKNNKIDAEDKSIDELAKPAKPTVQEKLLSEEEAKKVINDSLAGIIDTFKQLGEEHNWSFENEPDFNILRPELLKYASEEFTDSFLKAVKDDFYCSCDMLPYPDTDLDIRFTIHENTNNKLVASSIEFDNMISSGSTVYYTIIKENGKWVIDQYKWVSPEEEPVTLTWDEIKAHEENQGSKVELLNTTQFNGEKVYIFKYVDTGKIMGVFADNSGYMWDVPPSLLK